jgi:rubrerythrin
MMEDFTKVILQNAITKERIAQNMYLDLGNKAENEKIKDLFYRLAEEESLHEKLFSRLDVDIIKVVNMGPLKSLSLLKNINKENITAPETKEELNKVLDFAISEEQKAYEEYNLLLNHLDFGESRTALKEIALQELQHRTMLQEVKLQFNDDDWSHIKVSEN